MPGPRNRNHAYDCKEYVMPTSDSADTAQPIEGDQPLTLNVLRRLVGNEWARLPGETLVVLSRDSEGNLYSPFSTYNIGRYAPDYGLTGEVYPLESEGARAWGRRRGSSIGARGRE